MDEARVVRPSDPYGISKYAIELELECTHRHFGMPYIIFRPYNVYGERQNIIDRSRNVVGIFINQALNGQPMTIFCDGNQRRAFSYIDDVAPLIAASIDRPKAYNHIFNVGAGMAFTVNRLAQEISQALGCSLQVNHLPARKEAFEAYCTQDKIKAHFGDLIKDVPLNEGLAKMTQWAKTKPVAALSIFQELEIKRNIENI